MGMFFLCEKLKKTLDEVKDMSGKEFLYWMAYFKIKAEEEEKAQNKKGKSSSSSSQGAEKKNTMGK